MSGWKEFRKVQYNDDDVMDRLCFKILYFFRLVYVLISLSQTAVNSNLGMYKTGHFKACIFL